MPSNILQTKTCTKCLRDKSISDFCRSKGSKDGFNYWCKLCANEHRSAWSKSNPGKAKACTDEWVKNNHARKNASRVAWNNASKDRIAELRAIYRKENAGKIKAVNDAWRKANPDAARVNKHNRRTQSMNGGGKLSKGLSVKLFSLQNGRCACCTKKIDVGFHMDHIMPLAKGGKNDDSNIQLLCKECNLKKHAKHPIDFMQERGFLL